MSTFSLIPILFVAAVSIYLIAYISKAFISPFLGKKGYFERRKLTAKRALLERAEEEIQNERLKDAFECLEKSLFLDRIKHDSALIPQLVTHNNRILEKMLFLAELRSTRLKNLPILESQLEEQAKLITIAFKKQEKGATVTKEWAGKHYAAEMKELEQSLKENRMAISKSIQEIEEELRKGAKGDNVIVH